MLRVFDVCVLPSLENLQKYTVMKEVSSISLVYDKLYYNLFENYFICLVLYIFNKCRSNITRLFVRLNNLHKFEI